ncbi:unnamed protein product, partial [Mesorhabditis belari]|uniref:Uncharacterized protein n=1 Tax=Mesorhabditis belari TaxID=2138241 RepID=A0AAF3FBJ4_9BILA
MAFQPPFPQHGMPGGQFPPQPGMQGGAFPPQPSQMPGMPLPQKSSIVPPQQNPQYQNGAFNGIQPTNGHSPSPNMNGHNQTAQLPQAIKFFKKE